jgi:hypothetical protein
MRPNPALNRMIARKIKERQKLVGGLVLDPPPVWRKGPLGESIRPGRPDRPVTLPPAARG